MTARVGVIPLIMTVATIGIARAQSDEEVFFEKKVRPVLVQHCYECHGDGAEESGLRVDSREALLLGGERGAAIVPGKPDASLLISAVRHGELLKMPPKRKLSAVEVADLERWVSQGAPWPGASTTAEQAAARRASGSTTFSESRLKHWSFQRPAAITVPALQDDWVQSPIDSFVLKALREQGLSPASPAEKATLIRRATVDLLGRIPSPEELDAFLADGAPDAWPRLVDRLLASPGYGERWGRHWLDVARYADSNGLDENLAYAHAFRYRDYVIGAWNQDVPFDQFTREQIAGDLLPADADADAQRNQLVATGFLSLGAKMLAEDDPVKMQMDIVDEQVDTVGRVFLGMTLGCARCHDHKYDPISLADYYGLAGIFSSTKTMETHTVVARWLERPLGSPQEIAVLEDLKLKVGALDSRLQEKMKEETERLLRTARLHLGDYLLAAHHAKALEQTLAERSSIGAQPDSAGRPDVTVLEAENFARGNVIRDTSNYGQGIGVLVNRGETPNFAEYDVGLPERGLFQLEIRYAAASARPTRLYLNGKLVKPDVAAGVTGGWQPENQVWKVEGWFEFNSGPNVLRLEHPQAFPHIDKILIAPAEGADIPTLTQIDPEYALVPMLVSQWRKYLDATPADALPPSIKAFWTESGPTPSHIRDAAQVLQETARSIVNATEKAGASDQEKPPFEADGEVLRKLLYDTAGPFASSKELEGHYPTEAAAAIADLRQQKTELETAMPKLPEAMAVADDRAKDLPIHLRGSHLTLGDVAPRKFPTALTGESQPARFNGSGRLELANWIASPEHPLTARVLVNRVWQWHFGSGLVRSSDNFGLLGDRPTHPELLDWLAAKFTASDWSIKSLHRLILLSATYQMSTQWNAEGAEKDPDNIWLWRFNRRRMEAEAIRDSLLVASGQLEQRMGGSLLPTANRQYVTSTANVDPVVYVSQRRSVYLPVVRSALFDVFQAFDFADPSVSQGRRETTTIAPQALFLMNSQFAAEQSRALAKDLLAESSWSDARRIQELFRRTLGRSPRSDEVESAVHYLSSYLERSSLVSPDSVDRHQNAWQSLCRAILSTNEFVYVE